VLAANAVSADVNTDVPAHVLLLTHDTALQSHVNQYAQGVLGLAVSVCDSVDEFVAQSLMDPGQVVFAGVDLAQDQQDADIVLKTLEQQGIPVVTFFNRREDCARVQGRNIIASLDRDDAEQMSSLANVAQNVFDHRTIRILLLHSEERQRIYLQSLLRHQHYTVMVVADVADALEQLNRYPGTQLVILDDQYCKAGDFDAVKTLRKYHSAEHLAILGLTVQREAERVTALFAAGASDVMPESTDDAELLARIDYHANRISAVRALVMNVFRDALTGAYTRSYFLDAGEKIIASAQRGDIRVGVAMVNIDSFAHLNQQKGSDAGDRVLRALAERLQQMTRGADLVARAEGDVFLCLFNCVGRHTLLPLLNRLRESIETQGVWVGGQRLDVTVSIGGTTRLTAGLTPMLKRAQLALDQARKDGPNRCVCL